MKVINYSLIAFKNPFLKVKPIPGTVNELKTEQKQEQKKPCPWLGPR